MNLMYNFLPIYFLPIYFLLGVCMSMRNLHLPHDDERYFHHSDQAVQHYDNYQDYDSYSSSSNEVVMRQSTRHSKFRAKSYRNIDFSDSEYNYKCKCSCIKCNKRKVKPCCEKFCLTACVVQNNIMMVPYPVPYMVFNQSAPWTTTTTCRSTHSTAALFHNYFKNNRFHAQNMRRSMGNNDLPSPMIGRLPKYGIIPIPETLALRLMQQIKKDQNDDQLRERFALDKNLLDYTRRPVAY